MYIKKLINTKKEYWEYIWPFIDWAIDPRKSLWREEDLPKLKPFFEQQHIGQNVGGGWSDEVCQSFDYYEKCSEEYGNKNKEVRDSVSGFHPDEILEGFGFIPTGYTSDDEEQYTKDKPPELEEISFPFIVIGDIYCGWDRAGDYKVISIYQVSLSDFSCTSQESNQGVNNELV